MGKQVMTEKGGMTVISIGIVAKWEEEIQNIFCIGYKCIFEV